MADAYEKDIAAAAPPMPIATGQWVVWRHGGRQDCQWHPIYPQHATEESARAAYQKAFAEMRQGGVKLTNPFGQVVASDWAPRLRTRW